MSRLSSKAINAFLSENFGGELSANVAASTTSELVQIMTDAGIPPGEPENDSVLLSDIRDVIVELAAVYECLLNTTNTGAPLAIDIPSIETPLGQRINDILPRPGETPNINDNKGRD